LAKLSAVVFSLNFVVSDIVRDSGRKTWYTTIGTSERHILVLRDFRVVRGKDKERLLHKVSLMAVPELCMDGPVSRIT